jgi:hypothetical protein
MAPIAVASLARSGFDPSILVQVAPGAVVSRMAAIIASFRALPSTIPRNAEVPRLLG